MKAEAVAFDGWKRQRNPMPGGGVVAVVVGAALVGLGWLLFGGEKKKRPPTDSVLPTPPQGREAKLLQPTDDILLIGDGAAASLAPKLKALFEANGNTFGSVSQFQPTLASTADLVAQIGPDQVTDVSIVAVGSSDVDAGTPLDGAAVNGIIEGLRAHTLGAVIWVLPLGHAAADARTLIRQQIDFAKGGAPWPKLIAWEPPAEIIASDPDAMAAALFLRLQGAP